MSAVKNVVTLGVGAAPGGLEFFLTSGLGVAAVVVPGPGTRDRRLAAERDLLESDAPGRARAALRRTLVSDAPGRAKSGRRTNPEAEG